MHEVSVVFPHQLLKVADAVSKGRTVFLVEEFLFFRQYKFHKQKLILHRASMKMYQQFLQQHGLTVHYIDCMDEAADIRVLIQQLANKGVTHIHYTDTTDNWLEKRINLAAGNAGIELMKYRNPGFINSVKEGNDYFDRKKNYYQTDFYIHQRKRLSILLEANEKPVGGKWTYDTENRQKFPRKEIVPSIDFPAANEFVHEAIEYVQQRFAANPGLAEPFHYPVHFSAAEKWLDDFLQNRFSKFGIYEDAMVQQESILYHSLLSPLLNIGLLTPQQVINKALDVAVDHDVPLNSLEGFTRQIIGWREFIRMVYEREGSRQRTTNYWKFKRKIPASFWNGTTGIHPVDTVIKRLLQTGYTHHIERLMVLGNFMLLCEFDPDEVYRWFMEMYIDSYDWVMVPNVYGMTQFADGGLMTTKPYISGSNYLLKMGDWDKGSWQEIWDGLFWRFMHVHRHFFQQNPRLGMLLKTFHNMVPEKKNKHLSTAEHFLQQLDHETNE